MPKIKKGGHGPLNYTQKAHHRIYAGLGWDPNEKAGLIEKARALTGGRKTWHDLDLSCFLFDADGSHLDSVTPALEKAADDSGLVYHSGDNVEGLGDGDDEQISVELKDLPETIHSIVFVASIKTGHNFSEVTAPVIRLVDGYSEHGFITTPLGAKEGANKNGFVFARIYRGGEGWMLHNIAEFVDLEDINKAPELIRPFLA